MDTIVLSTVTSKGQITIPKQIRDRLRLQAGSRVEFHVDRQGRVTMRPRKNVDIRELKGIVRSRRKTPVSVDEMNEAIARGWAMRGLDTNVLVRYLVADDVKQTALAEGLVEQCRGAGDFLCLSVVVPCELVWVLSSVYGKVKLEVIRVVSRGALSGC